MFYSHQSFIVFVFGCRYLPYLRSATWVYDVSLDGYRVGATNELFVENDGVEDEGYAMVNFEGLLCDVEWACFFGGLGDGETAAGAAEEGEDVVRDASQKLVAGGVVYSGGTAGEEGDRSGEDDEIQGNG
ncbi:hypothetical protein R6Q59_029805 [Mikania micrantha]|uniref:Uncharacterized protein n=1 Tax=Mikania micrantha TaxID=192012 RepID=A0A5N6LVP2_9ASTR|nr:hypothetical protein E3N88_38159 [Mikania micrantha]